MKSIYSMIFAMIISTAMAFTSCDDGGDNNGTSDAYTVTFDSGEADAEADPLTIIVESPAKTVESLPAEPARHGYTFAGWRTEIGCGGSEFTASTTVTADITVYACWAGEIYTVTFDSQDADAEADPASKTVTYPETNIDALPAEPSLTGSTFAGWWTESDGGGTEFILGTSVTADITVFAYWTFEPVYTVTYSDCGIIVGEQHVISPETAVPGLPETPVKPGCDFVGWNTADDGSGDEFTASTTVTEDITVYAMWSTTGLAFTLINSDTEYSVSAGTANTTGSVIIPGYWLGKKVTAIGDQGFLNCTGLTGVTIPGNVASIGDFAFYNCSGLTGVNIPDNVTSIGIRAFYSCTGLGGVTIPAGVISIGEGAFWRCSSLADITVDAGNTCFSSIDGVLFDEALDTIMQYPAAKTGAEYSIPDGVITINEYAFHGCTVLTSVVIPVSVETIRYCAFNSCYSVTDITVDAGNTYFSSIDGVLFNEALDTIMQYPAGKTGTEYSIPDDVTTIEQGAFEYCASLTSVVIPDTVTTIGVEVFRGCSGLTNMTIPVNVTSISGNLFLDCVSLTSVTIPNGVTVIHTGAFYGCTGLECLSIPDSVTSIGGHTFCRCIGLTSMTIPANVTSIEPYTFYGCTGLKSLSMEPITAPGVNAGYNFTGVTGCALHIHSGAAGYGVDPWNNTGIFSKTLCDL